MYNLKYPSSLSTACCSSSETFNHRTSSIERQLSCPITTTPTWEGSYPSISSSSFLTDHNATSLAAGASSNKSSYQSSLSSSLYSSEKQSSAKSSYSSSTTAGSTNSELLQNRRSLLRFVPKYRREPKRSMSTPGGSDNSRLRDNPHPAIHVRASCQDSSSFRFFMSSPRLSTTTSPTSPTTILRTTLMKRIILGLTKQKGDQDLHHIRDGLFVSSLSGATNIHALKYHQITHILSVGPHTIPAWLLKTYSKEFNYKVIAFPDKPHFRITPLLKECLDFVEDAIIPVRNNIIREVSAEERSQEPSAMSQSTGNKEGGRHHGEETEANEEVQPKQTKAIGQQLYKRNVLVHCYAGHSRSVSVCLAYLMKQYKMTFDQALDLVRRSRPNAEPNKGFESQLRAWQRDFLKVED